MEDDSLLAIEHPFIRAPYEDINVSFRNGQKVYRPKQLVLGF